MILMAIPNCVSFSRCLEGGVGACTRRACIGTYNIAIGYCHLLAIDVAV